MTENKISWKIAQNWVCQCQENDTCRTNSTLLTELMRVFETKPCNNPCQDCVGLLRSFTQAVSICGGGRGGGRGKREEGVGKGLCVWQEVLQQRCRRYANVSINYWYWINVLKFDQWNNTSWREETTRALDQSFAQIQSICM